MSKSILKIKSYAFAILIVKLSHHFVSEKKEYVLGKQLLRSEMANGVPIREAEFAQSKADFIHKMSISLKKAKESLFRLDLLKYTNYINQDKRQLHYNLNKELVAIPVSSIKTTKNNKL